MDLRASLETRVLAAFAAAVLVVAGLAATTWNVAQDAVVAMLRVARTHEVLEGLDHVRADSLAIELATQSYRISGDAARLAERDAAIAARETTLRRLKELTADNARQQARWVRLRAVADQRLEISRRTELLRQTEGVAAASAYVAKAPLQETRERLYQILREMDEEELRLLAERSAAQQHARQMTVLAGALAALALAALLTATFVLIRRQLRAIEASRQALAESEQNLATTLHSIGDAVLATDAQGRVTRMNPVAERLTGWPLGQAQGRPVDQVFCIINEQTRASAVVPVAQVLTTGRIQGLANHTMLLARDGREWPIADSAAPIRDADGRISGVVLVFRDVTVERQAERSIQEQNELLEQRVRDRTARWRESEEQQRLMIESVRDYAILMLDPVGHVVTWNLGAERIMGYADDEIIGQHFSCFYPAADTDSGKPDAELATAAREGRFEEEGLRVRKNSATFWANVVVTPVRDPAGKLRGFVKITRDITEKKRAEEALRESEEKQRLFVYHAPSAIAMFDRDMRYLAYSHRWLADYNLGDQDITGRSHYEVFPDLPERWKDIHRRCLAGAVEKADEDPFPRSDGSLDWVRWEIHPWHASDGRIGGIIVFSEVVTARKRAEAAVRESEAKLRKVIDGLGPYMFVGLLTTEGVLIEANAPALAAAGLKPEDTLGRPFEQTYWWAYSEPIQQQLRAAIERAAGGTPSRYDVQLRAAEDVLIWVDFSLHPLRDETGKIVFLVPSAIVITERKQAEEEIRDLNASLEQRVAERTQQLEEANRAKSDFLANMSHELRTPLNSIIGFSEMLKDGVLGELDAKQRGFVGDIFGAGTHLLSLINDILDLSKVEAGMLQLEAGAVDLPALLKASTLVVREKALAHRIRLDTRLDPALGTVLADERKLKQIAYNLLSNAVKFTPDGGAVTLFARRCTRAEVTLDEAMPARLIALQPGEDSEFVAITLEDSGVGIAEADLAKLFEPFTQVDSSAARRHAGTGLGLSLVRYLAELHGGTVGVASRPGVGSRFSVWLPYREFAGAGEPAAEATPPSRPAVPLALVIDDDDRMADLITTQLHSEGFAVMRAATAEEGLVRAAKSKPDLITLDIFLPNMDGWEFMRRMKADPKLADTPVVIITTSDDLGRGLALGARRVLHKPFAREELAAALAGLVAARPDGEAPCLLVVDDSVKTVELVATLLQAEGYRVLRAYGGAEAIAAARRNLPDLVILDLMMPEVSGFEVARALRDSEQTARIPILVLTAKDLSAEDHARLNSDVSAVLAKADFNRSALLAELRRALPKRID